MAHLHRSILVLSILVLLMFMAGCGPSTPTASNNGRVTSFKPTAESQHAIFFTQGGWTGGGGDPLQTGVGGRPAKVDGLPVLLLSDAQKLVRQKAGKQPEGVKHGAILVEAQIHLERTRVKISTPNGSSRTVYAVVIEELMSSRWYTGK